MPAQRVVIPEKLYFRIGEVAKLAKLEPYVLRFWETEFAALRPTKSNTGQRLYRRREVELVLEIKTLLYEQGFTIAGARKKLQLDRDHRSEQARLPIGNGRDRAMLEKVRKELADVAALLERKR